MQVRDGVRLYSAGDLVGYLACRHLTTLSLTDLETPLERAAEDESAKLVQDMGLAHEGAYLKALREAGLSVHEISGRGAPVDLAEATHRAMLAGHQVIFQAALLSGPLYGRADFLRRVERPSALGPWSYEAVDTKLGRSPRAKFIIQLCFYSALLADVQGIEPLAMSLVLGDRSERHFRYANYSRYFRQVRDRFLAFAGAHPNDTYPERVDHCGLCPWREICNARWLQDDHLNQVAGITRTQIERLQSAGIKTLAALAELPSNAAVVRMVPDTVAKLQGQAALQLIPKKGGKPEVRLLALDPESRRGFYRMPESSAGDVFFDMEGDPYEKGGLEYLFGVYWVDATGSQFRPFWAHDRDEERRAFEDFMDFIAERMARHPRMHIYHYAHYEPSALKRLMSLHGTRENVLDDLLRQGRFVDLYKVVREAIRTSEPGYSLKDIEHFYLPPREGDVTDAGASIVYYERWKQTHDQGELDKIEAYNREDCRSTQLLHEWLLGFRPKELPWYEHAPDEAKEERRQEILLLEQQLEAQRRALFADAPADRAAWTSEHHVRELMGQLLDFHRRCDKPGWWELFARQDKTEEELIDDIECLGGLRAIPGVPPKPIARSHIYSFSFPEQETKLRAGKSCTRADSAENLGTIESLDIERRIVRIKISNRNVERSPLPEVLSIGPTGPLENGVLRVALRRVAESIIAGDDRFRVGKALLRKELPRVARHEQGAFLIAGSNVLSEAIDVVGRLGNSYVFIQGPPGAGKTFTGSRIVVELLRRGKRVGITSNSHKVIHNLLDAVVKAAEEESFKFHGLKKSSRGDPETEFDHPWFTNSGDPDEVFATGASLIAGTAWLFADDRIEEQLDYLFVDEAGQVSLANLVAMSTAAKNVVLLGDQMQLGQPIQGVHPGRSGESSLEYLLDGAATIASERGIFLGTTWRMHEDVCRFISDAVYDGRLVPEPKNQNQSLVLASGADPILRPTGIVFHPVAHEGRSQRCPEEAEAVAHLFEELLRNGYRDRDNATRRMSIGDILVVAPYNSQVNLLKSVLPEGARMGTIDKFQGQEAQVVLISMTTSDERCLPRNIEFLYDKNRLNVAVSRARCLAVLLASPNLLHVGCKTPEQMELVNTLCWIEEIASSSGLDSPLANGIVVQTRSTPFTVNTR
jgi:predicted RecB family nuclease